MSLHEKALEEWKERDPHLLDFEGFQRFLEEKQKEKADTDAWRHRESYCTEKLRNLVIKAVLIKEFADVEAEPLCSWNDFYDMARRYLEIWNGLGDWLPFDGFGVGKVRETLDITLSMRFAYDYWIERIEHPEWFRDWDGAFGRKGYSGDAYRLRLWLALCVKLGLEAEALEVLNNLPEELRNTRIPDRIKESLEVESWKETYKQYCEGCTRANCEGCVPYTKELNKREG